MLIDKRQNLCLNLCLNLKFFKESNRYLKKPFYKMQLIDLKRCLLEHKLSLKVWIIQFIMWKLLINMMKGKTLLANQAL